MARSGEYPCLFFPAFAEKLERHFDRYDWEGTGNEPAACIKLGYADFSWSDTPGEHMPADATAATSLSVPDLQRRVDELAAEVRAHSADYQEALRREIAIAEVLRVINSSPGNLAPVFDAILENAMKLCGADFGFMTSYDGKRFSPAAMRGVPLALADYFANGMHQPSHPSEAHARILKGEDVVHNLDQKDEEAYRSASPLRRAVVDLGGARSALVVALRKDDAVLGALTIYRKEVRNFSDKEVSLMQNFAAQAVVAMENARLITAQRESLERQTATTEVLQVINRSPGDLQPVFEVILTKAMALCDAAFGTFSTFDGHHLQTMATRGVPEAFARYRLSNPPSYGPGTGPARLIAGEDFVYEIDAADSEAYRKGDPSRRAIVDLGGARTILNVALRKDKVLLGTVSIYRQEVRPFNENQIAVLQNFADQAVIAMENARLLSELRESLEQQTATAEILSVINSSPNDLAPVFSSMLEEAMRLCGAAFGELRTYDGGQFHLVAARGVPAAYAEYYRTRTGTYGPGTGPGRILAGEQVVHIPDLVDAEPYINGDPDRVALVDLGGARANLVVPLRKGAAVVGYIMIYRREAGVFSEKQIALLQNFAAQAVIAMENARLLAETREALEQQTATTEILSVISQSPTDVGPVLSAVAKAAMKFCGANDALVALRDGDEWCIAAHEGPIETMIGTRRVLTRHTAPGRAMTDGKVVQIKDLQSDEGDEFPEGREIGARTGFRSALAAPLLRDDVSVGAISLRRREAGEFEPRQVELLKTFAAQAVIAIENVRLFTELNESLKQQTATSEILHAISQSPTDVRPVLDAVVKATLRFCGATDAVVILREGDGAVFAAHEGPLILAPGSSLPLNRETAPGRAILDGQTSHFPDIGSLDPVEFATAHRLAAAQGFRAAVSAPLLLKGIAIGSVALRKAESGPFTPRQIELLETFAAQAVIAIENVRLFTELKESLERLKAAQSNLIQAEKMASLGQLTAGIAHEIKNPLNFVNNFAGLSVELLNELKEIAEPVVAGMSENARVEFVETIEMITSNLDKIAEHGRRADGIVKSMLSHSRGGTGDWQAADINALAEEALNLAYHGARAQDKEFNITLERDFEKAAKPIDVVPQDVMRVFLNLFGNGFYAANKRRLGAREPGFRPSIRVTTRDLGDTVEVRVRDNGTGISADVRAKLFQPFFTTKPTGEGTGLGLSISYDIVTQQHGGTISVESEPDSFTEFTVRLPRSRRIVSTGRA